MATGGRHDGVRQTLHLNQRPAAAYHLVLRRRGVGDTVVASALVRDLAAAYPDTRLSLDGAQAAEVFAADARVRVGPPEPGAVSLLIDYAPTVDRGRVDRTARYAYAGHDAFENLTAVAVPRGPPRPDLVLTAAELTRPDPAPYAVVAAGVKLDMPVKAWVDEHFRAVVAATAAWNWKQVGRLHDGRLPHRQRPIPLAANLLGCTTLRDLVRLVAHADVVLGLVSLPMLLAGACGVPCVVVAGGREPPWFFAGLGVRYLDTLGQLPCCRATACYAASAYLAHAETPPPPGWLCVDPVGTGPAAVGRCMTLITPAAVVAELHAAKAVRRTR